MNPNDRRDSVPPSGGRPASPVPGYGEPLRTGDGDGGPRPGEGEPAPAPRRPGPGEPGYNPRSDAPARPPGPGEPGYNPRSDAPARAPYPPPSPYTQPRPAPPLRPPSSDETAAHDPFRGAGPSTTARSDDPFAGKPASTAPARPAAPAPAPARAAAEEIGMREARSATARRTRRARLVVRKVDPWSVMKFSLVFYFCLLLILLLATAVIFAILKAFGVIANLEELFRSLELDLTISGGGIFRWLFLFGLLGTVVVSAVTVLVAFLYNLIADVVGGIEISVSEPD